MGRLRERNCGPPQKQGVCHIVALPFTLKKYLKEKEEFMETQNISPCKSIPNLQKKSSKRNQKLSRYCNSTTNLKSQHKPKYHLWKILIQKIDLLPT
jgi:hypothetical protein